MVNWKVILSLIVILLASGIALAAFTYVYKLEPTVQRPVTEQCTDSFDVAEGYSFTKTKWLDLALPDEYDLTYRLVGDSSNKLKEESATISLDLNDNGVIGTITEPTQTINSIGGTVTFDDVTATASGQIRQKITITATARDNTLVGTSYADGDQDPSFDTVSVSLQVEMEPSRA